MSKTHVKLLQERVSQIKTRAVALQAAFRQAAEIRQSIELANASLVAARVTLNADDCLQLMQEAEPQLLTFFENWTNEIAALLSTLDLPTVRGLAHDAKGVTHYCVTADKVHGHGIFSAHDNKDDARFNALLTGGKCAAVDRSEDGRIVEPAALREARRIASEYC